MVTNRGQCEPGQAIDLEIALSRIPGGMVAVRELAGLLAEECPRLLEEIRAGIEIGEAARVKLGAHTLKGSADVYGARRVVAVSRRLELLGEADQLDSAQEAFVELRAAVDEMIGAIHSELDRPDVE